MTMAVMTRKTMMELMKVIVMTLMMTVVVMSINDTYDDYGGDVHK